LNPIDSGNFMQKMMVIFVTKSEFFFQLKSGKHEIQQHWNMRSRNQALHSTTKAAKFV